MMNTTEKRLLEIDVIDSFNKIPFIAKPEGWFKSNEYTAFIDTWKALVEHYRFNDTPVDIGVVIVQTYLQFTSFLKELIAQKPPYFEQLEYTFQELTAWMDELMKEAERNLYLSEEQD